MSEITKPRNGLFKVSRTSIFVEDLNVPPCDGAFLGKYMQIDRRRVSDNTDSDSFQEFWKSRGSNHRVENGYHCREIEDVKWFVEISDIMEFVKNHGECVISIDGDGFNCIEIYDYYRE
jgi:uncharacterized membrane protein